METITLNIRPNEQKELVRKFLSLNPVEKYAAAETVTAVAMAAGYSQDQITQWFEGVRSNVEKCPTCGRSNGNA